MSESTLLAGLSADDRREVLAGTRACRFAAREVLFHVGDPGEAVDLLIEAVRTGRLSR